MGFLHFSPDVCDSAFLHESGVIIQIRDQIVRIITGAQEGSSDEVATYGKFDDLWAKVKAAAEKLRDDAKEKIQAAIDRLKPQILEGLKNIKEVVINEGKKIIIQIKGEIVRIITGATEASSDDY